MKLLCCRDVTLERKEHLQEVLVYDISELGRHSQIMARYFFASKLSQNAEIFVTVTLLLFDLSSA